MEYITFDENIALIFKEKHILLKKEKDGQIRPIKDTSRKDVYEALYEIQELLREEHLIDY